MRIPENVILLTVFLTHKMGIPCKILAWGSFFIILIKYIVIEKKSVVHFENFVNAV